MGGGIGKVSVRCVVLVVKKDNGMFIGIFMNRWLAVWSGWNRLLVWGNNVCHC